MPELYGKTVIVSGAAGGIGGEIVRLLDKTGAHILATDTDELALRRLESFRQVKTLRCDVRSKEDWENAFRQARSMGQVYCLINAVGVIRPGYIDAVTEKDIDFHIDINTKGVMLGCALAAAELKRAGSGHIINIASLAGVAPIPGIALYSASKFAVRGFTLALAAELRGSGVYATVVCPDAVKTPMLDLQKDYPEAALTFSGSRPLSASEVAETIVNAIGKDVVEIALPTWRAFLAKTASALPQITPLLADTLRRVGLANQEKYQKG